MLFKNANVFYNGAFQPLDIQVTNDRITNIGTNLSDQEEVIDCTGKSILPGLIDIHSHGCVGCDFTGASMDDIEKMRQFYLSTGVTSILATTMTIDLPTYRESVKNIGESMKNTTSGSRILGINMEGPFLGEDRKGAHDANFLLPPTKEVFDELDELSGGNIKLIDLDPKHPGALEFIRHYSNQGKVISLAHTSCDYELAGKAIEAGATHITHLFNAMNGLHHRNPGMIGAVSDYDIHAEMICDGIHVHPCVIRMMFKVDSDKIILISDSMCAAGLADGEYELGGQKVFVRDKKATLEDGTIAGSTVTVYEALKRTISFGVPKEQAILSATLIPAKAIHMEKELGSIECGKLADLLIVDDNLAIEAIYQNGVLVSE